MSVAYLGEIRKAIRAFDPERRNRYFIFGSAARERRFHDIDLGVVGNSRSRKSIGRLQDIFYDAPIPYKVDIVDMDSAGKDFRDYVLRKETLVWI